MMNATDSTTTNRLQDLRRLRALVEGDEWRAILSCIEQETSIKVVDMAEIAKAEQVKIERAESAVTKHERLIALLKIDDFDKRPVQKKEEVAHIKSLDLPAGVTAEFVENRLAQLRAVLKKTQNILQARDMASVTEVFKLAQQVLGQNDAITVDTVDAYIKSEERQASLVKIPHGFELGIMPSTVLEDAIDDLTEAGQLEDRNRAVSELFRRYRKEYGSRPNNWRREKLERAEDIWAWYLGYCPNDRKAQEFLDEIHMCLEDVDQRYPPRERIDFRELSLAEAIELHDKNVDNSGWSEEKLYALARTIVHRLPAMRFEDMSKEQMEITARLFEIGINSGLRPYWRKKQMALADIYRERWGTDTCWLDEQGEDTSCSDRKRRDQLAHKKKKSAEAFVRGNDNGRVERPGLK